MCCNATLSVVGQWNKNRSKDAENGIASRTKMIKTELQKYSEIILLVYSHSLDSLHTPVQTRSTLAALLDSVTLNATLLYTK